MPEKIIKDCYKKSLELLISNSSEYGILASSDQKKARERNYLSVFARDASICSMGMIASKNKKLTQIAKKSLITLAKNQAHDGEIPNFVKPGIPYVDFWKMGSIDATLWWLIAVNFFDKHTKDKRFKKNLKHKISKAIAWLYCQEHNQDYLLKQTEASDWADIMPRNGRVLYSNSLWYHVKEKYNLKNKTLTRRNFNILFNPNFSNTHKTPKSLEYNVKLVRKSKMNDNHYKSFVSLSYWGDDCDVFGNSLAMLFGLSKNDFEEKLISFIKKQKTLTGFPVPSLFKPILETDFLWRDYMKTHRQNFPHAYHNGGTWPFLACFFAMALKKHNQGEAEKELCKIAKLNKANNWGFYEWFHSKTGQAHGMRGQSWNAGAFLLAYHYIYENFKI